MRKLAIIFALLCGFAHGQILSQILNTGGAVTSPGFVQAQNCSPGTLDCNVAITATSGNSLFVAAMEYSTTTSWTIGDTLNTYNVVNTLTSLGSCCSIETFLATNITGGALSITCDPDQGLSTTICIVFELTPGTAISVDQLATGSGGFVTSWTTSATPTTTQANEILISCGGRPGQNVLSITAGTGFTIPTNANLASIGAFCEYELVSVTGAYAGSVTVGTAASYVATIATLK